MKTLIFHLFATGALSLLMLGCNAKPTIETAPVAGQVRFDGEPLATGSIVFENVKTKMALVYDIVDGKYEAASYQYQGLPPGVYDVAIKPITTDQPVTLVGQESSAPVPKSIVPKKYFSTKTSGLQINVEAGRKEPFDFLIATK